MSDRFFVVVASVLSACAIFVTGVVARREFVGPGPGTAPSRAPTMVREWRKYSEPGTIMGIPNAPITITEFSDFQCPYCRQLAASLKQLRNKYPDQIAVAYRHFPIDRLHRHARSAAHGSVCSSRSGSFEKFHDALFALPDSIGQRSWVDFAKDAGIFDTVTFLKCMADSSVAAVVEADLAAGKELGVKGTPTVLVNQWRFSGTPSFEALDSAVRSILPRKRR